MSGTYRLLQKGELVILAYVRRIRIYVSCLVKTCLIMHAVIGSWMFSIWCIFCKETDIDGPSGCFQVL